jgi:hypothetical protein
MAVSPVILMGAAGDGPTCGCLMAASTSSKEASRTTRRVRDPAAGAEIVQPVVSLRRDLFDWGHRALASNTH